MKELVIDTDIGTDPDDAFALIYAIKNKADIKAVTTVIGNTEIRAKIARKLERIVNSNNKIPIIAGCSGGKKAEKYWCGFEHLALTPKEIKEPFQNNKFPEYNSETTLVCIAPLTNITLQLEKNPSIRNVKNVYIMGTSSASHNLKVDPEATRKVFAEPWTIYQITKQVSKKIYFTIEELENLRENELGNSLYNSVKRWFDYTGRTEAPMYDVLTVSAALGENFVKFKKDKNTGRFISYDVDLKLKDKIVEVIKNGL